MKCPYCHQEVADDDIFCGECGRMISGSPQNPDPYPPPDPTPYPSPDLKPTGKGKGPLLAVGLLVALLAAGLGIFAAKKMGGSGNSSQTGNNGNQGIPVATITPTVEAEPETDESVENTEAEGMEEAPAEVRPEDVTVSFISAPSDAFRIEPIQAGSSSELVQENKDSNSAWAAMDQRSETSWQEGVSGSGIGETLWYRFGEEKRVKYLSFQLGNWRDSRYAEGNNRPKTLNVTLGDFSCQIEFPKKQKVYWLELSEAFPAEELDLEIVEVYKGTSWDDTCIAEIGIYEGWD